MRNPSFYFLRLYRRMQYGEYAEAIIGYLKQPSADEWDESLGRRIVVENHHLLRINLWIVIVSLSWHTYPKRTSSAPSSIT